MSEKTVFITIMGLIISFGTASALMGFLPLKYAIFMTLGFAWVWTGAGKAVGFVPAYARRYPPLVWAALGIVMLVVCLLSMLRNL